MKKLFAGCLPACAALVLCLVMLFQTPIQAVAPQFHYGKQNELDEELSASGLFEALFGEREESLTSAEREALDALSGVALRYNRSIPDSVVERDYDGTRGVLTVRVKSYDYIAANGKTVSWIPASVSMDGGEPVALTPTGDGSYTCVFSDLWHSDDDLRLSVDFVWQVEIPQETADGLLTFCYTVARDAMEQMDAYLAEKQKYDTAEEAYLAYCQASASYAEAKRKFEAYVVEKQSYDQRKAAYDAYLVAKAEYDAKVKAYQEYLEKSKAYAEAEKKYYDYEAFRKEYASVYDEYERYTKELERALSRLDIMESMFLSDSHGWQFYGGVMGSTVDAVLANRDKLEVYLVVDPGLIDVAEQATRDLRPLLKGYAEVRSASYKTKLERYRAEFAYYSEHYEGIRDNIRLLFQSLFAIYSNSGVQSSMNMEPTAKEKLPHFQQFLGQLYVLYCALDDGATRDDTWPVVPKLNLNVIKLVEEKLLLPDNNQASPAGVTLPEVEVKLPGEEFPEPVEKPVKDFEDWVGDDPTKVGAPAVVANPGNPPKAVPDPGNPPSEVLPPQGEAPVAPSLPPEALALADELRAGILPRRNAQGTDQLLTMRQTVSCIRSISNRKTVTFYDLDGKKLEEKTVEYGDPVQAPDMIRQDDERYSYVFLGWMRYGSDDSSERVNLQSVTEDLSLSPIYRKTDKLYEIIWQVNGIRRVEYYKWGQTPACPVSTDRPSNTMRYTFTGFSPEVTPVQGNAVYTAQYLEEPLLYHVTWIVGDRTEQTDCGYGEMPVCPIDTARAPSDRLYEFLGWNQPLQPVTQDVTYRAEYRETVLGLYNDGSACPAEHTETAVVLRPEQATVHFAEASAYARQCKKNLTVQWDQFTVTLTPARLAELEQAYCTKLECKLMPGDPEEAVLFSLRYLNSIGKELEIKQAFPVKVTYTPVSGMYAMVYRQSGTRWVEVAVKRYDNGTAEFSASPGVQMLFQPEYGLQYSDPTENSNLTALPPHAPAGGTVELNANCTFGYEISSAVLVFADGTEQAVGTSFVMPRNAVAVRLNVTPIIYHVTFVSDGVIISEQDVFFGDAVTIPADPEKAEDDLYVYSFSGWSPYVTRATGEDRNPVYTASYSRTPKQVTGIPDGDPDRFLHVMVPILCTVAAVFILAVVLCIVFRRKIKAAFAKLFRRIALCFRKKAPEETHADSPESEIPTGADGSDSGENIDRQD